MLLLLIDCHRLRSAQKRWCGFHTRAYRLPSDTRVRFEVESPQTQMVKRETLQKGGIP